LLPDSFCGASWSGDGVAAELLHNVVDEFEVQLEQSAQEAVREPQIFGAVGQPVRAAVGVVQKRLEVGDVVAEGGDALARDVFTDEVADQQAQQRLALDGREADRS
jgi:hypothetical protein